jgi:hypothetical protein
VSGLTIQSTARATISAASINATNNLNITAVISPPPS